MAEYSAVDAPTANLVASVRGKHHKHLDGHRIEVVFRSTAAKSNGKVVLGKAKKITGLAAFLADDEAQPFFVIELALDVWENLSTPARVALIDHELMHCGVDYDDEGEAVLVMVPHDVEEFGAIVARHGLWTGDLQEFGKAVQMRLPGTDG